MPKKNPDSIECYAAPYQEKFHKTFLSNFIKRFHLMRKKILAGGSARRVIAFAFRGIFSVIKISKTLIFGVGGLGWNDETIQPVQPHQNGFDLTIKLCFQDRILCRERSNKYARGKGLKG